jgi:hypothetical protein
MAANGEESGEFRCGYTTGAAATTMVYSGRVLRRIPIIRNTLWHVGTANSIPDLHE